MLTDEKIESLWRSIHHGKHMATGFNTFARAIEDAVREEMAKQEPVAWMSQTGTLARQKSAWHNRPLYAAPVVPDDMVMVPREPSEAMIKAARHAAGPSTATYTYKAMIAAAEKQNAG